jgi:putative multiple sugar transport system substrate-binding protein
MPNKGGFMKKITKHLAALLALTLLFITSCTIERDLTGQMGASSENLTVGISMPTKSVQRWDRDGQNLESGLQAAGYKTMMEYANDSATDQVSQLENMINAGCDALIVAAVDSSSLSTVLSAAKAKGIYVISYDRLITDTDAVDFYVTFDNYKVGELMGQYIEDTLNLETATGPIYLEVFAGPPSDNNASFFYGGAMDILTPYIEKGVLKIASGQVTAEQTAIDNWELEKAQSRMENILNGFYSDKKVQVVDCANDGLARGVSNALLSHGYQPGTADFPLITGQDCEIASIRYIIEGKQSMSVFKDTRILGEEAIKVTDALLTGKIAVSNGVYNNRVFDVPSYNCELIAVTKDNYKEVLIDSGYYTEADLGLTGE